MAVSWRTLWSRHTGFNADSVEWCPVEPYRNILVCGTYQLDKKDEGDSGAQKQKRMGRIYLFVIDHKTTDLTPIQTIDIAGVLDQKWCYHSLQGHPTLAVVTSEGNLQLYQLHDKDDILSLKLYTEHSIGQNVLALSVDWSSNKYRTDDAMLVVSDSLGAITILKVTDKIEMVGEWKSHGFEAWIAAFNYWNPNVFYSGGDDCVFKSYDMRIPDALATVNRSHEAGVTSVRSHVDVEHQMLTGSYDEKIRLWDARKLKTCIAESNVNGGVWRLKWHPQEQATVLAACMYGGFRLLEVGESVAVTCEYMEHESIAYGADWQHDQRHLVATCSFYDCKLHVSEIN